MSILKREQAYEKLRYAITYGDLKPGEKIVETTACEMFKVGRTPLREALRQLQTESYIAVLPNKGAIVRKITREELDNVYDVLSLLEGDAVGKATLNMTSSQVARLDKVVKETNEPLIVSDYKLYFKKNEEFHALIREFSGNAVLKEEIEKFRRRIFRYRALGLSIQSDLEILAEQHATIAEKMAQKKASEAKMTMREHFESCKRRMVDFLRDNSWL